MNILFKKLALPQQDGIVFIHISNFMWLEANGSYTYIHLPNNEKMVVSKTLQQFENTLPSELFSRVHHSYIINHNFIKKYYSGRGGYIELENGIFIEVSYRKKGAFLSKFIG